MLPRSYVHALYAYIANEMVSVLPPEDLTALWMEEGVGNHNFEKSNHGKTYVERRFGQNAARAIVGDQHDRNMKAQQDGVVVVNTQSVAASLRDLLRTHLPSTADLYPVGVADARYLSEAEWTEGERKFVEFSRWLSAEMNLPVPKIIVLESPRATCEADSSQSGTLIRINRSGLAESFFATPRIANWLPLIVHELAHRTGNGHDAVFWREVERLAGEAAEACWRSDRVGSFLV